jgi:hypothetical protein
METNNSPDFASGFVFLLAIPKFHWLLASWRVVIRTRGISKLHATHRK